MTVVTVHFQRHHMGPLLRAISARLIALERAQADVPMSISETAMTQIEVDELTQCRTLLDEARRFEGSLGAKDYDD